MKFRVVAVGEASKLHTSTIHEAEQKKHATHHTKSRHKKSSRHQQEAQKLPPEQDGILSQNASLKSMEQIAQNSQTPSHNVPKNVLNNSSYNQKAPSTSPESSLSSTGTRNIAPKSLHQNDDNTITTSHIVLDTIKSEKQKDLKVKIMQEDSKKKFSKNSFVSFSKYMNRRREEAYHQTAVAVYPPECSHLEVLKDIAGNHKGLKECYLMKTPEAATSKVMLLVFHKINPIFIRWTKQEVTRNGNITNVKIHKLLPKFQMSSLDDCTNVSEQIKYLHNSLQLSEGEVRYQFFLQHRLFEVLKKANRKLFQTSRQLACVGSLAAGLSMQGYSDLDMTIFTPLKHETDKREIVYQVSRYMSADRKFFRLLCRLPYARVPIIKLADCFLGTRIDVSFNQDGQGMSELLYTLDKCDTRFYPFLMTLKYWGKCNGLTAELGFSSHMMIMFAVAFLQNVNVLPAFSQLLTNEMAACKVVSPERFVEVLKAHKQSHLDAQRINLDELLLRFFEFYSEFHFHDQVLDIYNGTIHEEAHLFTAYVVNPLDLTHNVCTSMKINMLQTFKDLCTVSYYLLQEEYNLNHCSDKGKRITYTEICNNIIDEGVLESSGWGIQRLLPIPVKDKHGLKNLGKSFTTMRKKELEDLCISDIFQEEGSEELLESERITVVDDGIDVIVKKGKAD